MKTCRILVILAATLCLLCCTGSPAAVPPEPAQPESHTQTVPPRILFVDADSGPVKGGPGNLGTPISIFGKGFGAERGASKVMIGDAEVASYLVWGSGNAHNKNLDLIVVQPGAKRTGGAIKVIVNDVPSNAEFSFRPEAGNIFYLSPSGSDSKGCSESAPCASVAHAISTMKPGDVVLMRAGTYTEGEIWIRGPQGGAPGRPKAIKNYPGEEATFTNSARDFYIDADHIAVSGLNFRNGKALFLTGWASRDQRDNRLLDNTFAGRIAWAAIEITGNDHLVAGNVCDISGSTVGTMGHCYYVSQGSNVKILYNVASGAPGYGLHIYDEQREKTDFQRVIRDVLVEGNVFKASKQRSGMVIAITDAGGYGNHIENVLVRNNIFYENNHAGLVIEGATSNVSVYNNTFYQNGRQGMFVDASAVRKIDIRNNLFYQSGNSVCEVECGDMREAHVQVASPSSEVTVANNSYGPGKPSVVGGSDANPILGSVSFMNETGHDFHVRPGSSAIARGVALSSVPTDFDGRLRSLNKASDIGAFEHE